MEGLIRKSKNAGMSNLNNGALGSRKCQSNPYKGEDMNGGKDGTRNLKLLKSSEVLRKSNIQAGNGLLVPNEYDSKKEKGRQKEVMAKEKGMNGQSCEGRATRGNCHKQMDTTKTKEAPNSSSSMVGKKQVQGIRSNLRDNSSHLFGMNHSRHHRDSPLFMEGNNCSILSSKHVHSRELTKDNSKSPNRVRLDGGNGKTNDDKSRRRKQPLLKAKVDTHGGSDSDGAMRQDLTCGPRKRCKYIESNEDEDNGINQRAMAIENGKVVRRENLAFMPRMKQRRCIETNEDEANDGYQNPFGVGNGCEGVEQLGHLTLHVEDGTADLTPDVTISKHCVKQHYYCCSMPIDKPKWSGLFNIGGKEYISLDGHLSTKWCEKIRKLSSLPPVVQLAKVPRLAVWPSIWKTSKPTGDNIGLYLFPHEMRHDKKLDQLVKEVVDKDLVLQAVLDEAEMLIFPSVLLPERYQTFQTKHYLWAAFKAKEDRGAVIAEQEEEKEKHHVPNQLDEVQSEEPNQIILTKRAILLENPQLPAKSIQEVEDCGVQWPTNMRLGHEASEGRRHRDSSHQAVCNPTEATSFATVTASFSANHGPIDPSTEAPPGSSTLYGIVVRQVQNLDPKVEQFIQEMEQKGALVAVMQGQASGESPLPSNFRTAMQ
ncbi:hypothetical protein U9M48_034983 [Paspalum notatum var. saurae]|uniref:AIPP2-like SPOC-like domain-containing protein n=1 Tax=Paspalum notatum var. saurae TaxID=547442 RepID=A0AAQ3UC21_PASNO